MFDRLGVRIASFQVDRHLAGPGCKDQWPSSTQPVSNSFVLTDNDGQALSDAEVLGQLRTELKEAIRHKLQAAQQLSGMAQPPVPLLSSIDWDIADTMFKQSRVTDDLENNNDHCTSSSCVDCYESMSKAPAAVAAAKSTKPANGVGARDLNPPPPPPFATTLCSTLPTGQKTGSCREDSWWDTGPATIAEVMSTPVVSIHQDADLLEARAKMAKYRISSLLVDTDTDSPGFITKRNFLKLNMNRPMKRVKVKEVMTQPVISLPVTCTVSECSEFLEHQSVRRVLIYDNTKRDTTNWLGAYVGIVADTDIFRYMGQIDSSHRQSAEQVRLPFADTALPGYPDKATSVSRPPRAEALQSTDRGPQFPEHAPLRPQEHPVWSQDHSARPQDQPLRFQDQPFRHFQDQAGGADRSDNNCPSIASVLSDASTCSSTSMAVSTSVARVADVANGMDRYRFAAALWELDFGEIELLRRIGAGSFGEVLLGSFRGTKVAVKRLRGFDDPDDGVLNGAHSLVQSSSGSSDKMEVLRSFFEREIEILATIRHPNVVNFIGACHTPPNVCLVTEFCARGSLDMLLHKSNTPLDLAKKVEFAMDVARGMSCLHAQRPPVIHRDLKSANLLVSARFEVKVADFGLSRIKNHAQMMISRAGMEGTVEYCAPEVLRGEPYTEKCDVWSFGVVLWELLMRRRPYADADLPMFLLMMNLGSGALRLPRVPPSATSPGLARITERCMSWQPAERPPFREILHQLENEYKVVRGKAVAVPRSDSASSMVTLGRNEHCGCPPGREPPCCPAGAAAAAAAAAVAVAASAIAGPAVPHGMEAIAALAAAVGMGGMSAALLGQPAEVELAPAPPAHSPFAAAAAADGTTRPGIAMMHHRARLSLQNSANSGCGGGGGGAGIGPSSSSMLAASGGRAVGVVSSGSGGLPCSPREERPVINPSPLRPGQRVGSRAPRQRRLSRARSMPTPALPVWYDEDGNEILPEDLPDEFFAALMSGEERCTPSPQPVSTVQAREQHRASAGGTVRASSADVLGRSGVPGTASTASAASASLASSNSVSPPVSQQCSGEMAGESVLGLVPRLAPGLAIAAPKVQDASAAQATVSAFASPQHQHQGHNGYGIRAAQAGHGVDGGHYISPFASAAGENLAWSAAGQVGGERPAYALEGAGSSGLALDSSVSSLDEVATFAGCCVQAAGAAGGGPSSEAQSRQYSAASSSGRPPLPHSNLSRVTTLASAHSVHTASSSCSSPREPLPPAVPSCPLPVSCYVSPFAVAAVHNSAFAASGSAASPALAPVALNSAAAAVKRSPFAVAAGSDAAAGHSPFAAAVGKPVAGISPFANNTASSIVPSSASAACACSSSARGPGAAHVGALGHRPTPQSPFAAAPGVPRSPFAAAGARRSPFAAASGVPSSPFAAASGATKSFLPAASRATKPASAPEAPNSPFAGGTAQLPFAAAKPSVSGAVTMAVPGPTPGHLNVHWASPPSSSSSSPFAAAARSSPPFSAPQRVSSPFAAAAHIWSPFEVAGASGFVAACEGRVQGQSPCTQHPSSTVHAPPAHVALSVPSTGRTNIRHRPVTAEPGPLVLPQALASTAVSAPVEAPALTPDCVASVAQLTAAPPAAASEPAPAPAPAPVVVPSPPSFQASPFQAESWQNATIDLSVATPLVLAPTAAPSPLSPAPGSGDAGAGPSSSPRNSLRSHFSAELRVTALAGAAGLLGQNLSVPTGSAAARLVTDNPAGWGPLDVPTPPTLTPMHSAPSASPFTSWSSEHVLGGGAGGDGEEPLVPGTPAQAAPFRGARRIS